MQCRIYPRKTTVVVAPIEPGGGEIRMGEKSKRRKREIADLVCRMNETAFFVNSKSAAGHEPPRVSPLRYPTLGTGRCKVCSNRR